ncbi:MAG TPA: TraB/GumN family protein [Polyangiaceae bacterium]|nr:TraB/GumN family protein [Polyangiaceae bacterium]
MPFSDNVTELTYDHKRLIIVGTAHVSQRSVDEVREVIEQVRPDSVCVELDKTRHDALVDEARWRKLDIFQVIRQKKVLMLMASLALAAFQRRLGDKLGVKPGAEMLAALQKAKEIDAQVVLADRDIQATLKRTWAALSLWNKARVAALLMVALTSKEEITEERIEELKERDTLNETLQEFAEALPQVKEPLIDERDRFLISSIREAPGETVVAVVGAAHVQGMVSNLEATVDRDALSVIPPAPWSRKLLKWILPLIVIGAFYFGFRQHEGETLKRMIYAWVIPNAVLAGILALVAGAKPLTVLLVSLASPITSLNPTIGAGMVGGLVEAWLRKPTVADCERVSEDSTTLRGIYRNAFSRVLLVAVLSTIGSALGAYVGATWVVLLL